MTEFALDQNGECVSDATAGLRLCRAGPETAFWDINDAELIRIDAPGYVALLSVRLGQDEDAIFIGPGPSPTHFIESPAGEDFQVSFDWLSRQWPAIDSGLCLLFSQTAGGRDVVTDWT